MNTEDIAMKLLERIAVASERQAEVYELDKSAERMSGYGAS